MKSLIDHFFFLIKSAPVLVTLAFFMMSPVNAEVIVNELTRHYDVTPENGSSLLETMREKSPIVRDNQVFFGSTQWNVLPNYRHQKLHGLCRVKDIIVRLQVRYTLPIITEEHKVVANVRDQFKQFYRALYEHEQGHRDLGSEAAHEIYDLLDGLIPYAYCSELEKTVNEHIMAIISKYKRLNKVYDKETDHGRTQGAVIR